MDSSIIVRAGGGVAWSLGILMRYSMGWIALSTGLALFGGSLSVALGVAWALPLLAGAKMARISRREGILDIANGAARRRGLSNLAVVLYCISALVLTVSAGVLWWIEQRGTGILYPYTALAMLAYAVDIVLLGRAAGRHAGQHPSSRTARLLFGDGRYRHPPSDGGIDP